METSKAISPNNPTVFIQANPQATQNDRGAYQNMTLKGFFEVQRKALGAVQIMVGVVVFLFGIVLSAHFSHRSFAVRSGITYWGSFVYIGAGSLYIAVENKFHPSVVKASVGVHVFTAVTSVVSIVLMCVDIGIISYYCYHFTLQWITASFPLSMGYNCSDAEGFGLGIIGTLMVLTILQFTISVCTSIFACKAICNTMVNVPLNQGY